MKYSKNNRCFIYKCNASNVYIMIMYISYTVSYLYYVYFIYSCQLFYIFIDKSIALPIQIGATDNVRLRQKENR